ncbi:HNH endonuclease signature motif containing protein [Dyadobacter sp. CY261]|uniref:HNH endonuclease signature motif containing protein n=1 Tax=Dyadobacter sp. CY261 TaxID=2907203 RepID=UPI0038D4C419
MEVGIGKRSAADVRKIRNSRVWRDRIRPDQLRRFPYCQKCDKKGILKEAVEVDHIIPLEQGGEPLDSKNLQSLCKRCHILKSSDEARKRQRIS